MSRLAIGILGTGQVASDFAAGVRASEIVVLAAVGSRDAERAKSFAQMYTVAQACSSYEEVIRDPSVDAVYVALPNTEHEPWTLRAIDAGKHVICEKPLAPTVRAVRTMIAAARARGVVLMEAFPYYFQEQTTRMLDIVRAGDIGKVRFVQASIGFSLRTEANIRLDPALGGGALLDVGCYAVSFCRLVIGQSPIRVCASRVMGSSGVEHTFMATLAYPSGVLAQIASSMVTGVHRTAVIGGSAGVIETGFSNHLPPGRQHGFRLRRGAGFDAPVAEVSVGGKNGFLAETEAFARFVECQSTDEVERLAEYSIDNVATLESLKQSAIRSAWVDVASSNGGSMTQSHE